MKRVSGRVPTAICVSAIGLALLLSGCGQTGVPQPPSLKLPTPVTDLTAIRTGGSVRLQWTMPRESTDKLPLKGAQPVHICRKLDDGACVPIADPAFAPEKVASYDDALPAELSSGPARLLAYTIGVRNHKGHSAGDSNTAYVASGAAPAQVTGFTGRIQANGVLLQWQPQPMPGLQQTMLLHRTLISAAAPAKAVPARKSPAGTQPVSSTEQTLAVAAGENADPGRALDTDALFDQRYRYQANRVLKLTLKGHSLEIDGEPSQEIAVNTKDVFPPEVPAGLAVVPVPDEDSIDLSWRPDTEADLAGYFVYRRDTATSGAAERLSQTPVAAPAFRDSSAWRGHEYAYSVSAIDHDGNESARSPEVKETLSNQ